MYLIKVGEFFGTGVRDFVSVPVPEAEQFMLASEGITLASAYRHESGRYTECPSDEITDDTILYSDWRQCLADQVAETFGADDRAEFDRLTN